MGTYIPLNQYSITSLCKLISLHMNIKIFVRKGKCSFYSRCHSTIVGNYLLEYPRTSKHILIMHAFQHIFRVNLDLACDTSYVETHAQAQSRPKTNCIMSLTRQVGMVVNNLLCIVFFADTEGEKPWPREPIFPSKSFMHNILLSMHKLLYAYRVFALHEHMH